MGRYSTRLPPLREWSLFMAECSGSERVNTAFKDTRYTLSLKRNTPWKVAFPFEKSVDRTHENY